MSLTNFIPSVWAARLLANLEKSLIYGQAVAPQATVVGPLELKSKRVLRHSCWCLSSTGGSTHGPAREILPQSRLLGLRPSG